MASSGPTSPQPIHQPAPQPAPQPSPQASPKASLEPIQTPNLEPTATGEILAHAAGEIPTVEVSFKALQQLELSPLAPWAQLPTDALLQRGPCLALNLHWHRQADDPRELSEIAEVRLWSLRADAAYPWLPLVLERSSGQLTRHVAMLLPHSFSRSEGIRFAPESLELWITHRVLWLDGWARGQGLHCRQGLTQMAAVLGFELDPTLWAAVDGLS